MRKLGFLLAFALLACSTYRDHLHRGQRLYQENEFDRALAIWRALEDDMPSLTHEEQARYAYLRGMTDYRLGFKRDARHWLAIAKAINQEHPGGLHGDWAKRTDIALGELNAAVFGGASATDSDAREHDLEGDLGAAKNAPSAPASAPKEESTEAPVAKPSRCEADGDCSSDEICVGGRCMAQ
ncbi:MAG: hypothetical protein RJA70_3102 [Pseudomonadota bacterium]|jgi:hypothetical protein